MPKAYILITEDVKDPAGMAEYAKLAGKAMAGSTLLSFDQKPEALEGEWHGTQTVLLEFESVEAAREWYNSDAYQEAAKLRQAAADCNGVILHGLLTVLPRERAQTRRRRGVSSRHTTLARGKLGGTSGPVGVVVVACTSNSASSRGRLRNGECDVSIVNCSTPRRRVTVSASHRGID